MNTEQKTGSAFFSNFSKHNVIYAFLMILILGGSIGFNEFRIRGLEKNLSSTKQMLASTTEDVGYQISRFRADLDQVHNVVAATNDVLQGERTKNSSVEDKLGQIYQTVGTLDKLSKTDRELLQKYSKVYFLNEHYIPSALTTISSEYSYGGGKNAYQIHTNVAPFLDRMVKAAKLDGKNILVISAYRSFSTQSALKNSYKITYGAGTANKFSADQGYSEHQLGTTMDFTTPSVAASFSGFDRTPEFLWLVNNAYKYGFVLSYPAGNKYYMYEPWHWRFVGVALATQLYTEGKYFYDEDQRTIDDYLVKIFD